MNTWQAIVSSLKAEKVRYLFGLPGGELFYDALYDAPEIRTILVREETAGPFMAMGFARISGRPGICFAPSGPGVAHLVPGILEAHSACLPVIAIGCSSKRANAGMGAFQEVDQISIMKPITKWCERVTEPERISWVMRRAFSLATNGKPGPVFLDIPRDVGAQKIKSGKFAMPILFVPDLKLEEIRTYYTEPENFFGYKKCVSPWFQLDVMPNGDTVTCRDFPDFVTGNIKESSILEIYNGEKHRKFRRALRSCGVFPICSRCCGLMGY